MSEAFTIYRYIQKRMKACKVPAKAISCDTDKRILETAKRALERDWITKKRKEELHFIKVGNVWIGDLKRI